MRKGIRDVESRLSELNLASCVIDVGVYLEGEAWGRDWGVNGLNGERLGRGETMVGTKNEETELNEMETGELSAVEDDEATIDNPEQDLDRMRVECQGIDTENGGHCGW